MFFIGTNKFLKILLLLTFIEINCTFIYRQENKSGNVKKIITIDSLINDPIRYHNYNTKFSSLLKDEYYTAMRNARALYVNVIFKAESIGIGYSPWLDTCCVQIRKIDSILKEKTEVKYCDK